MASPYVIKLLVSEDFEGELPEISSTKLQNN